MPLRNRGLVIVALLCSACRADEAQEAEDRARWPLIYAAGEGDSTAVADLLSAGTDVMQRSKDGETALHVSAVRGNIETVRLLLQAGAEVDARTPKGSTLFMTPIMWAICAKGRGSNSRTALISDDKTWLPAPTCSNVPRSLRDAAAHRPWPHRDGSDAARRRRRSCCCR